jgi:hypothetical protein
VITDRDMAAKDRVAARTAKRISAALNRMPRDLPESVAAQAALADVIAELYAPGTVVPAADLRRRRYPRSLRRRGRRATSHAYCEAGMTEVAQPNEHEARIQQAKKPRKGARFLQIVAKPARPMRRKTKHKLTRVDDVGRVFVTAVPNAPIQLAGRPRSDERRVMRRCGRAGTEGCALATTGYS